MDYFEEKLGKNAMIRKYNNAHRLAYAIKCISEDKSAKDVISHVLHYSLSQLDIDVIDLSYYISWLESSLKESDE